jgi:hypothetical protein
MGEVAAASILDALTDPDTEGGDAMSRTDEEAGTPARAALEQVISSGLDHIQVMAKLVGGYAQLGKTQSGCRALARVGVGFIAH